MTFSWTLQTATDYGLGILAQGQAYSESFMKLHPLSGLNEVTEEIEATFTAFKVKGGVFRCPENCTQLSAKTSLVFNGLSFPDGSWHVKNIRNYNPSKGSRTTVQ